MKNFQNFQNEDTGKAVSKQRGNLGDENVNAEERCKTWIAEKLLCI